jgi:hypothetical protein
VNHLFRDERARADVLRGADAPAHARRLLEREWPARIPQLGYLVASAGGPEANEIPLDDREYTVGSSALLSACRELSRRLERGYWSEPLRAALKDLLQIASARDPSMQSIALEGRRIAEVALRVGLHAAEDENAKRRRADLAAPHLELLLAHGRSAAAGETIVSDDAVMILYAAMRVAEMTGAWA